MFAGDDLRAFEVFCLNEDTGKGNVSKNTDDVISANAVYAERPANAFTAKSRVISDLYRVMESVALSDAPVLLTGENGSGKNFFARKLHLKSKRKNAPFVRADCIAFLQEGVFENRIKNYERMLATADGGTLFFDGIEKLPLNLQTVLLDRMAPYSKSSGTVSDKTAAFNVRIIASAECDLEASVKDGRFLIDLYHRLNTFPINIPPLRERKEDIEPLAEFFLKKFGRKTKKQFSGFSSSAAKALHDYYWPGNVRELKNTVEYACILGEEPFIQDWDLRFSKSFSGTACGQVAAEEKNPSSTEDRTLKAALSRFKRAYICKILDETSWNQTKAGKILGIQRTYISRLLNELHVREDKDRK